MTIWKGWTWARGDIDMLSLRKDHEYYREGDTSTQLNLAIGWRREHAHRVWSAMQAVLAVAAVEEVRGSTRWDWVTIADHGHPYVVAGWAEAPE